jgi:aryl-alcohol dehydrogenase-like predicted oxidoreductase
MEYRHLGDSGLLVSTIGLGTNNLGNRLDERASRAVVHAALDVGVTFIDTADIYGLGASETILGAVLGDRRRDVILATKVANPMSDSPYDQGNSRRWIMRAVEGCLRRLRTDWIDLLQLHVPDPATPIEETLRALDDLVRSGKVTYVGYSNFDAWQLVEADWTSRTEHLIRPIATQHYFNLLRREPEAEVVPVARKYGLGIIPYFPLESGFLTGKFGPGRTPEGARLMDESKAEELLTPESFERLARFEAFATDRGHSLLELAIGWLLSHAEVGSVITSASVPDQIRESIAVSTWRLDPAEMEAVAAL